MRYSKFLLVLTFMFLSGSAQATLADCPACRGEQPDWTESATAFLEGKPIQDTPSTLSGPQQARLLNSQIDARKEANQAANITAMSMADPTAMLDLELSDIRAMPNPSNFGEEVEIIAVFRKTSSNSTTLDNHLADLAVIANITNSAGSNVARANLKPLSENEYSGIWKASVTSGMYNVTIETSGPNGSKAFNNALQIEAK